MANPTPSNPEMDGNSEVQIDAQSPADKAVQVPGGQDK